GVSLSGGSAPLHSFPTRRSSDLAGPGAPVLPLGGGDVDAHALRGSRLELDIGEALELARCVGDARAGDGHVGLHDLAPGALARVDRKSTRLNSSHVSISYAVFCL